MGDWGGTGRHGEPVPFLSSEIISTETGGDRWKPVTLYVVRITATGRREVWTVYRRYSKFFDLRVQLQKRFQDHAMPPIPPKRLLGKEDPQFIEQRRLELDEFLNALLKKPVEISLSEEVCLFLEVPEPLRVGFLETDVRIPTLLPAPGEAPHAVGFGGGAPDESRVTWLLKQLQDVANTKVASIRTFEDWILKTKPPLTEANVRLLYLGLDFQGGLLEEVGAFEHSEVSSIAALGFLCKLLSHEYGCDAPLFRSVLRHLDHTVLLRMRLQHHIHRNRGQNNRLDAFRVLRGLELPPDSLMTLLQDDFAFREFQRWQDALQSTLSFRTLHQSSYVSLRTPTKEPSRLIARPALSNREYKKIAEDVFTQVNLWTMSFPLPDEGSSTDAQGKEDRTQKSFDSHDSQEATRNEDLSMQQQLTSTSDAQEKTLHSDSFPDVGQRPQWRYVPCPEPSWKAKYCMRAAYQRASSEQQSDAYIVRVVMRLPFPAIMVACLLADHVQFIKEGLAPKQSQLNEATCERLKDIMEGHYLSQLQSITSVESLKLGMAHEAFSELLECVLSTPTGSHTNVRLWLLVFLRILPAAAASVSSRSGSESPTSNSPSPSYLFACTGIPPVSGILQDSGTSAQARIGGDAPSSPRAHLLQLRPTGIQISAVGEAQSELNLCAFLGKDSIRLVSGDLLGERLLFWRTLENILFVLEQLDPMPADFSHPLLSLQEHCLAAGGNVSNAPSDSPISGSISRGSSVERSCFTGPSVEVEMQVDGADGLSSFE